MLGFFLYPGVRAGLLLDDKGSNRDDFTLIIFVAGPTGLTAKWFLDKLKEVFEALV